MKLACLTSLSVLLTTINLAYATALDDYIAEQDPAYTYSQYGPAVYDGSVLTGGTGTTAYTIQLTSQTWRNASEVSPATWNHWLTIIVPQNDHLWGSAKNSALLIIDGKNNSDPPPVIDPQLPGYSYDQYRQLAFATRSVIIELRQIPNQPLQFTDETTTRSEDQIIAYSWDKFLKTDDQYWPVQLPMVKAVVKAMDTAQQFIAENENLQINQFILTGASKRGWTAWLTAAVDNRVSAIAPIVCDLLNMQRSFAHHWSVYGFWAQALLPYQQMQIFQWFDTTYAQQLINIVDPYKYIDRLNIPKLIITASGDDFFVHDSSQFYLHQLPGETFIRTIPNTNHYLENAYEQALNSMIPYYHALINNKTRPDFSWNLSENNTLTIQTSQTPEQVLLWQANNTDQRDFRLSTIGPAWNKTTINPHQTNLYQIQITIPPAGWTSFFAEVIFDYQASSIFLNDLDYHFTTEPIVLPQTRPFEADFNRDTYTNTSDILIIAQNWLNAAPYYDICPRRNGDGIINLREMSIISSHWLNTP